MRALLPLLDREVLNPQVFEELPPGWDAPATSTSDASEGAGLAFTDSSGAVATPCFAPDIRWRMLSKPDGSLELRIDQAFSHGEDPQGQWHSSPTKVVISDRLAHPTTSPSRVIQVAMRDLAAECIKRHNVHRRQSRGPWRRLKLRHGRLYLSRRRASTIDPSLCYDLLSERASTYLKECARNFAWLPSPDLTRIFAQSCTQKEVLSKVRLCPSLAGRVTRMELALGAESDREDNETAASTTNN